MLIRQPFFATVGTATKAKVSKIVYKARLKYARPGNANCNPSEIAILKKSA